MKERIQKVLAAAGVASRRSIEEMVQQGRVAVNGKVVTQLPIMIDPATDRVTIDDEPIKLPHSTREQRLYFMLNKPKGVYSTNAAQGEQRLAIDLLPQNLPGRLYPVGRLDADSKGLLLLTNDGELTNLLTHPRYGVPKTYVAAVDGYVTPEAIERMRQGIWLADPHSGRGFKARMSGIRVLERTKRRSLLEITLTQGYNRQVRRMLAAVGHKVRELTRVKFGPLTLKGLPLGAYRQLTPREIEQLRAAPQKPDPSAKPPRKGRTAKKKPPRPAEADDD
jgi:23S rRNA pseudouridine2605 synthase